MAVDKTRAGRHYLKPADLERPGCWQPLADRTKELLYKPTTAPTPRPTEAPVAELEGKGDRDSTEER